MAPPAPPPREQPPQQVLDPPATHHHPPQWQPSQWQPSQWQPSQWQPSQWQPSQWQPTQWQPQQYQDFNWQQVPQPGYFYSPWTAAQVPEQQSTPADPQQPADPQRQQMELNELLTQPSFQVGCFLFFLFSNSCMRSVLAQNVEYVVLSRPPGRKRSRLGPACAVPLLPAGLSEWRPSNCCTAATSLGTSDVALVPCWLWPRLSFTLFGKGALETWLWLWASSER